MNYLIHDIQNNDFFAGIIEEGDASWTANEEYACTFDSLESAAKEVAALGISNLEIKETLIPYRSPISENEGMGHHKRKRCWYKGKPYYGAQKDSILKRN